MQIENNDFEVVLRSRAKAKNGTSPILIETSIHGLIYRTEVYMDEHIIDALEVNCSDISESESYLEIFKARYIATHNKFESNYTTEKIYAKMLTKDGEYLEGEGSISVITSISDRIYKVDVFLDSQKLDSEQREVLDGDDKLFKAKYTQAHKDMIKKYILVPRFPANTFINPVIKKFPMYRKSPLTAFFFFLATVVFVLWLISIIACGKAMKKIVTSVAGKEAGLIVKDLQKTMCIKGSAGSLEYDENGKVVPPGQDLFVILPDNIKFENKNQIYPVYIKNNMASDILVIIKDRIINNFENAMVDPNMIIRVINKKEAVHIKSGDIGLFEFKLESSYLQPDSIEEISYDGNIILQANNLTTKEITPLTISFEFLVEKSSEEGPLAEGKNTQESDK